MKKLSRIAALLAASAMLFGAVSCSDGSDSGSSGGDPTPTPTPTGAWSSSWKFSDLQGVAANIKYGAAQVAGNTIAGVEALTNSLTAFPTHSASGDHLSYFYCLSDVEYPATSGDHKMIIQSKDTDTTYSFHNNYYGLYTATTITQSHTPGCLEICGDALSIAEVQGPFKVTVVSTANGSSDKSDRGAYIKVGATLAAAKASEAVKSSSTAAAAGDKMVYSYAGTDKVTVVIGCSGGKSIRVFDVKVEQDTATFTPSTNDNTENTIATLGLIGATVTSSDETVATAEILEGKIKVTSKKAGEATLTVTDANSKTATIAVEVASSGAITVGTITKYAVAAPTVTGGEEVATVTSSIEGLVYAANNTTADADATAVESATVTLSEGKYYFWYKASDAYAASAKTEVTVDAAGALSLVYFGTDSFDTSAEVSYAGTSSDSTAISGNDLTWAWSSPFEAYTGSDANLKPVSYASFANKDFTTGGTTDSHSTSIHIDGAYFYPNAVSIDSTGLAKDTACATATFTITASKAITLKSISAKMGQSQTGNVGASVKIGSTTVKALAGAKDMSFNVDLSSSNIYLASGETVDVEITVACAKAWTSSSASNKTLSVVLGDLTVKAVQAGE